MTSAVDAGLLDRLAAEAWAAPLDRELDGWRLRYGFGLTGRANSVWPRRAGGTLSTDEKIETAEAFYRERGLAPRFQLSPASEPAGLDGVLEARGYDRSAPTTIQVASCPDVVARTEGSDLGVEIAAAPDRAWLAIWLAVRGLGASEEDAARAVLEASRTPAVHARLGDVAVGRVSLHETWGGIFAVSTRPQARRQGAARAILHALARRAAESGIERLYLQVEESNAAAQRLYAAAGFTTVYAYYYRLGPA
jgi:ribosomal protein S18 acetylase RimI-like enzyme